MMGTCLFVRGGHLALSQQRVGNAGSYEGGWAISAGLEDSKEFMELKCLEMSTLISSFHVSEFQGFFSTRP